MKSENKESLTTGIVVTCRNYGRFLKKCLGSIKNQSKSFDIVILIDDGSSDSTHKIWKRHFSDFASYKKVNYLNPKAARDEGIKMCQTDLVVCLDADDWLHKDYLRTLSAPFCSNPRLGVVYCERKKEDESSDHWFPADQINSAPYSKGLLFTRNFIPSASLFRKKAWVFGVEGFGLELFSGEVYAEDWETWLAIALKNWEFLYIPEKLIHYRIHENNYSKKVELSSFTTEKIVLRRLPFARTFIFFRTQADICLNSFLIWLDEQKFSDTDQIFCLDSVGGFEGDGKERQNYQYFDFSYIDLLSQASWFVYSFQDMKNYILGNQIFWVNLDEMKRLRALEEKITASKREEVVHPKLFCHPDEGLPLWIQMDYLFFLGYLKKIGGHWELSKEDFLSFFPQSTDLAAQILKEQSRQSEAPCVSIVVPVKNSACHLERLLKSLESLNYPKDCMEIIVVDNDSTDSTVETAQRFADVYVYIEKKASSYAARNKGIISSTHDFIAFLDADCVADSNWLKEIVEPLVKDKRVGFVGGINRPLSEDAFLSKMERGQGGYRNIERKAYCGYGYAITMNVIYRRKVFQSVGMFDDTVISGSDVDMSWRAQKDGKWRFVRLDDKALVYHDDIKSFKRAFHRHHRIGSGHYFLYFKKYPHWLLQHYFFLPRSEVEIYAQFIKLMLRSFLVKRGHVSFFEEFFIHFRAMAQKIGLLNAMKNEKARSQIETIYIYDKGCDLSYFTCEVQDLITRSSSPKEIKLFIGGAYKGIENLFFYFKQMLKLTTVWVWPNDTMYIKPLKDSKWQSIFGRMKKEVDLNEVQKVIYAGKDKDSLLHFLNKNFKQIVFSEIEQTKVE